MTDDRVTLRDVYDAINRVEDNLKKEFNGRLIKVEQDIEHIKSFQNRFLGVMSIISLFLSAAATYIWNQLINR